jgi:gamma-glutamyltranspeptidase / glutathione hydrolase
MHVTKTLVGVIDFGLSLDKAIKLPNLYFGGGDLMVEQGTILADKAETIAAYGQKVRAADLGSKVNGVQWDGAKWVGSADPRAEGTAAMVDAGGAITTKAAQIEAEAPTGSVH